MNKVEYVNSHFKPVGKEINRKISTGEKKKGFFGGEKEVMKTVKGFEQTGYSDSWIDGERLTKDISISVANLNKEGYEVVSITPVISGQYDYYYNSTGRGHDGDSGYGYGYGYSYTEGVVIIARKSQ